MAQTQIYAGKTQVHLVEESSQDTYLAPAGSGTGMVLASNVSVTFDSSNYEPNYVREDYLAMDEIPGPVSGSISFSVPIRGGGAIDTPPEFGEMLKACGFEETTNASTSVTYTPLSVFNGTGGNPGPSYSVSILMNGVRHAIAGAFGNVVFNCNVDDVGMMDFTFQGQYQAFADDGLEAPTYDTTTAPAFRGASFATNFGGSYTPKGVTSFSLDMGNRVVLGKDANESTGFYGARIVGRKSTGSFDAELTLAATNNFIASQRAGTTGTITTGTVGSTEGNRWSLAVARAVLRPIEVSDRDGIAIQNIPFAVSSAYTAVEGTNFDITLTMT